MRKVARLSLAFLIGILSVLTALPGWAATDAAIRECITDKLGTPALKAVGIRVAVKRGIAEYAPYLSLPRANRYNPQLRKIAVGCGATKVEFNVDQKTAPQPTPK